MLLFFHGDSLYHPRDYMPILEFYFYSSTTWHTHLGPLRPFGSPSCCSSCCHSYWAPQCWTRNGKLGKPTKVNAGDTDNTTVEAENVTGKRRREAA